MLHQARAIIGVFSDVLKLGALFLRSSSSIRTENLVLRRQLAQYIEWGIKPRRVDHVTRASLAVFSRLIAVTATFRMLYVFVPIEHGTRRLVHINVTASPSADWTVKQLREVVGDDTKHSYLIHDRDCIYSKVLDESIKALGLEVLRTPVASPRANSICERVIGTIRRECLDWLIPMSEKHLRAILREWVTHYNGARVHKALGPGVPDPPKNSDVITKLESRHRLAPGSLVRGKSILGGLHHEYSLSTSPRTHD